MGLIDLEHGSLTPETQAAYRSAEQFWSTQLSRSRVGSNAYFAAMAVLPEVLPGLFDIDAETAEEVADEARVAVESCKREVHIGTLDC